LSNGIASTTARRESGGLPTAMVGGFATVRLTRAELAALMVQDCLRAREHPESTAPKLAFSSNGQGIALAGRDTKFADAMSAADIIDADGMPIVVASRFSGSPLPERIATTDFFHDAASVAAEHGLRFFLLGATEEQNSAAVVAMEKRYPSLKIVGRHHGYFGNDDEGICKLIRESRADVVWVGLGKPLEEYWCLRNRERLTGVGWIKTCGGLYSFLAGDASRAPKWMQRLSLEWLHRVISEPRRLAWRYIATNPYALYRLIRYTKRSPHEP